MHESFDLNISRLVSAINAFEGLTVIGGCAGHPDPQPDQWPEGVWYVMFTIQRTDQGWFALEFLAWAINNDYRRGGHQVLLSPIAPPPYLNEPGQSLQFAIEGSAGANATVLATWLNRLRAECYVAPGAARSQMGQQADRLGAFCKEVDMIEAQRKKLILAVDGSPHSDAAIEFVAGLDLPASTAVHVLAVAPELWSPGDLDAEEARLVSDILARIRKRNREAAQQVAARVAEGLRRARANNRPADLAIATEIREGHAAEAILERAAALPADLIAIGARGLSAPSAFGLGATAHKIAAHAGCAVLVAKPPADVPLSSVVLAVDGSHESQRAVEWVCALALPRGAEVAVISLAEVVGDFPADSGDEREYARDADLALMQRALLHTAEPQVWAALDRLHISGAQFRPIVRTGQPAAEIVRIVQEQDADLLIIGARGQTRAEPFPLGGVAEKLVRFAPCSVLVAL